MQKRLMTLLFASLIAALGLELGETWLATGTPGIAQPAQAIVGRPLTPLSVAGVARRTVARCAVGVVC